MVLPKCSSGSDFLPMSSDVTDVYRCYRCLPDLAPMSTPVNVMQCHEEKTLAAADVHMVDVKGAHRCRGLYKTILTLLEERIAYI